MSTTARSETRHTEEPWEVDTMDPTYIRVGRSPVTRRFVASTTGGDDEANAARIVACVNGCAGVADPQAVAEVLEACEAALPALRWAQTHTKGNEIQFAATIATIELALAKARGVAPGGEGGGK